MELNHLCQFTNVTVGLYNNHKNLKTTDQTSVKYLPEDVIQTLNTELPSKEMQFIDLVTRIDMGLLSAQYSCQSCKTAVETNDNFMHCSFCDLFCNQKEAIKNSLIKFTSKLESGGQRYLCVSFDVTEN